MQPRPNQNNVSSLWNNLAERTKALDNTPVPYMVDTFYVYQLATVDGYQRTLNERRVRQIARDFDWSQFQPPVISRRADGSLYVIDGQHRIAALRSLGLDAEQIPALVYSGLTDAEEANLFNLLNSNHKDMTPREKMRSLLWARDPFAVEIDETVRRHGYKLHLPQRGEPTRTRVPGGMIEAIGALVYIQKEHSPGTLNETLGIIAASFGTNVSPQADVLRGVASFINRYRGRYDRATLIRKLAAQRPDDLSKAGVDGERLLGGTRQDATGRYIVKIYNSGKRSQRLPEWDEMGRRGRQKSL